MEEAFAGSNSLKVLIIADVDIISSGLLAEKYVKEAPTFDMILLCGPFTHRECSSQEEIALVHGDISAIVAQLENIVCRVCYLGSEMDPTAILTEQLHLTPNSINIHARRLPVCDGLFLMGFAETAGNLKETGLPEDVDRSAESDEEMDGVGVQSTASSIEVIEEILEEGIALAADNKAMTGMFCFHYKYTHTLNHVLFHMPNMTNKAGVKLMVMPPSVQLESESAPNAPRLPARLGPLTIATPGSLRQGGHHCSVSLSRGSGGEWNIDGVENLTL